MKAPTPDSEAARMEALHRYRILDTAPEKSYDDVAKLASFIGQTPIALVSLISQDRQWFKSRVGLNLEETARDVAFCAHTILQSDLFIVEDALADERFADNPLVTGEPKIRFYAGAPLITADGHALGALCVMDRQPRKLNSGQKSALQTLARMVVAEFEQRRISAELAAAAANVRTLRGLLPICSYCKGVRNDHGYWLQLEAYLEKNTEAHMTHGICPVCIKEHFPQVAKMDLSEAPAEGDETKKLKRLLKAHTRLLAEAQEKAHEIDQLCADKKGARRPRPKQLVKSGVF